MTRTRWRWWHVLLAGVGGVLAFLVVATVLGGVLLLQVLSEIGSSGPQEDDLEVVAARDLAAYELTAEADRLTAAVLEPALAPGAERVGRGQVQPPCAVGQHNWKIDDDFDLACSLSRVEVVTAPRRETFTSDMRALDAALRAEGWSPSPVGTMSDELRDWRGDVAELSGTSYTRTVAGRTRTLGIRWTTHGDGYAVVATEGVEYFRQ